MTREMEECVLVPMVALKWVNDLMAELDQDESRVITQDMILGSNGGHAYTLHAAMVRPRQASHAAEVERLRAENEALSQAVAKCVDAMRDWIVPHGITSTAAMERVTGALDNPEINPVITQIDQLTATGDRHE